MLKIHTYSLGSYQTNCYIVHDEAVNRCAIIDPGYQAEDILEELDRLGLQADAILLTHGHFDHVGAVEEICRATGCQLWISRNDWEQKKSPITAYLYPIANSSFAEVRFCQDGDSIQCGGVCFTVLATPGHTPGSVCYLCGDSLFSGDTLFAGSCGRTDLPGGDWNTIQNSLKRLSLLEGDYAVYPGHGESTTLAAQRRYNPYMR